MMLFPALREPVFGRQIQGPSPRKPASAPILSDFYGVTSPTQCKVDSSDASCVRWLGLIDLAALMADL